VHAHRRRTLAVIVVTLALVATSPARAQTQWMDLEPRNSVRLEMSTGGQENDGLGDGFTGAVFATVRIAVGARTSVVAEVPYAHGHVPNVGYATEAGPYPWEIDRRSTLGNPYVGAEHSLGTTAWRYELGARLPVADPAETDGLAFGRVSGVEHEDAFVARTLHLRGAFGYDAAVHRREGVGFDARVAPVWAIVTHNPPFVEAGNPPFQLHHTSRMLFDYDVNMRVQGPNARLVFGVAGLWAPVGSEVGGETRAAADATILLKLIHLPVHPGLGARIPLESSDDPFTSGRHASTYLGLSIPFGGRASAGA